MECRGRGCREVGAGGSLGGSEGRGRGEVEGLEAGREAGLNESSGRKKRVLREVSGTADRCGLERLAVSSIVGEDGPAGMLPPSVLFFPDQNRADLDPSIRPVHSAANGLLPTYASLV